MTTIAGVGIGLRKEFYESLLSTKRHIDWLEIVSENYIHASGRAEFMLDIVASRWPIIPHGVGLSVGSTTPDGYLTGLAALTSKLQPAYFSDHLCYSSIGARNYLDLLPLPRHEEAVARVVKNVTAATTAVGLPIVLENITTYAEMPGSEMSESAFLRSVAERANAGLLLDVNNLYINAMNQQRDPMALLNEFPIEHVKQLHLAGHSWDGDVLLDTHDAPIAEPVWHLFVEVLKRCGAVPTLIEWDQHIPALDVLLDQADHARQLMDRYR